MIQKVPGKLTETDKKKCKSLCSFLQDAVITAVKHRGNKYALLLKGLCV